MSKKIVSMVLILFLSATAFAFGGGGGGGHSANRRNEQYRGVDSVGIHIDGGDKTPDITFTCDDPNATPNIYGVCDCNEGYQKENDVCVINACHGFTPSGCQTNCTSINGQATYTLCDNCYNDMCQTDPAPVEPIDCDIDCGECQTCDASTGSCVADDEQEGLECVNGVCRGGICKNLCDGVAPQTCMACDPTSGNLYPDANQDNQTCDTNSVCQGGTCVCDFTKHLTGSAGSCICDNGYFGDGGQCAPCPQEHASCPGGSDFICLDGYEHGNSGCICASSKYIDDQDNCVACPANATCDGNTFTCIEHYTKQENSCVNLCLNYQEKECNACDYTTGGDVPAHEGEYCNNKAGKCNNGTCQAIVCNACEDLIDGQCVQRDCGLCKTCDTQNNVCVDIQDKEIIGNQCVSKCTATQERIGLECMEKCGINELRDNQNVCQCDTANKWYGTAGSCMQCTGNGVIYDGNGCACETGYYGDGITCTPCPENGICSSTEWTGCKEKYKQEGDLCVVDACFEFNPLANECITACTSLNGVATYSYATTCHDGAWICNATTHACENPCDGQTLTTCQKSLTPQSGQCVIAYYEESERHTCAQNKICDNNHSCVCDITNHWVADGDTCKCEDGYEDINGTCLTLCPEHTVRYGTECVCDQANNYYSVEDSCKLCDVQAGELLVNGSCICNAAESYYGSVGSCSLCSGTGKIIDNNTCVCDETQYDSIEDTCYLKCATGAVRDINNACQCDNEHGYYGEANNCQVCSGNNKTIVDNECVCQNGYLEIQGVCEICPPNAVCNNGVISSCTDNYQLNEARSACVLDPCLAEVENYSDCLESCLSEHGLIITETFRTACENGYACDVTTHQCVDPCAEYLDTACVKSLTRTDGKCVVEYQDSGFACDTNKQCNVSHECVCTGYMKDSVCTACPEHATCDGTTFTCDQDYLKEGDVCVTDACVQLRQDYPDCLDTCTSSGGVPTATYKTTCGTDNNWSCNATTHLCENPCDGQTPTGCVKTLTPVAGVCSETEYQPEGYECDTNKQCNGNGSCVCPDGKYETDAGLCSSCDTGGAETSEAECNQCPGNFYVAGKCFTACTETQWMEAKFDNDSSSTRQITSGICRACTSENPATAVSEESCNTCAGTRFMAPDMMGGPKCFYCDKKDIAMDMTKKVGSTTILPTESYIASCNACLNRTYNASTKKCVCDSDKIINDNECCPAGQIADPITKDQCIDSIAVCDAGEVYSYDDNACIPCQQADGKLTPDCTNACSNWNMVYDKYGYCHNPPAEGYIIDDAGKTYSCDSYIYMFGVLSKEMCDRCPDRFYAHSGSKRLCVRCDYKDPAAVYSSEDCAKCSNNLRALDPDAESPSCICNASLVTVSRIVPTWNKEAQEYVSPTTPSNIRICQELSTP